MKSKEKCYFIDNTKVALVVFLFIILFINSSYGQSMRSLTIFRPGDAINVVVWEYLYEERRNLDFSGVYPINPEGYVALPLVGEVRIKALTLDEVTKLITAKYSDYLRNPYVYVRPLIRVTMQGAFVKPGVYRIDPSSSLWDLVALAGGPDAGADLERLQVKRGGDVIIKGLLNAYEKGYSLEEIGVESGDQVILPGREQITFRFIISIIHLCGTLVLLYLRIQRGY